MDHLDYTARTMAMNAPMSWSGVALFIAKAALLVLGLYAIREAVYFFVPGDAAGFATAGVYCFVPWLYLILAAKGRQRTETLQIATTALAAALVGISILYLLFG